MPVRPLGCGFWEAGRGPGQPRRRASGQGRAAAGAGLPGGLRRTRPGRACASGLEPRSGAPLGAGLARTPARFRPQQHEGMRRHGPLPTDSPPCSCLRSDMRSLVSSVLRFRSRRFVVWLRIGPCVRTGRFAGVGSLSTARGYSAVSPSRGLAGCSRPGGVVTWRGWAGSREPARCAACRDRRLRHPGRTLPAVVLAHPIQRAEVHFAS